jgi:hypothetical protein
MESPTSLVGILAGIALSRNSGKMQHSLDDFVSHTFQPESLKAYFSCGNELRKLMMLTFFGSITQQSLEIRDHGPEYS